MSESPCALLRDPSQGPQSDDGLQIARGGKAAADLTVWDRERNENLTSGGQPRDRYRRKLLLQAVSDLTYAN